MMPVNSVIKHPHRWGFEFLLHDLMADSLGCELVGATKFISRVGHSLDGRFYAVSLDGTFSGDSVVFSCATDELKCTFCSTARHASRLES